MNLLGQRNGVRDEIREELTDAALDEAFAVSDQNPLFRAIIEVVSALAMDMVMNAADQSAKGNTAGAATFLGAFEFGNSLVLELERRREIAVKRQ